MSRSSKPPFLMVGRICRAHGLQGEVQVDVQTDFPEQRFQRGNRLWVGPARGGDPTPTEVIGVRDHRTRLLLRLDVASDRDTADALRGQMLYVRTEDAAELDEGAFWIHELEGLAVIHTDGETLGHVKSVMETGGTDVLVVRPVVDQDGAPPEASDEAEAEPQAKAKRKAKEILLPLTAEVIVEIDIDAGRIVVDPLEGMLG